jgi:uncharacterized protein
MPISSHVTPGIYVDEVAGGPRPIQAVGTSTAAFVGEAPKRDASVGVPRACNNCSQFLQQFTSGNGTESTPLATGVYGFFENGGSRCFVVNTGRDQPIAKALDALRTFDEVAIVAAPGVTDGASHEALLSHCEREKDRVAILDPREDIDDINLLTQVETVEAPDESREGGGSKSTRGRRAKRGDDDPAADGALPRQSNYGVIYFPWITIMDPLSSALVDVAPSGHMAGVWARTDATRGVHKAPANEPVNGALNLTYRLTRDEQGILNQAGVNGIRLFAREGIRVWGARTLGEPEWVYINVRRLFNMMRESIAEGTSWIVFEPHDATLRKHVRRDVGAFLTRVWRDGALVGATPEEAFYVKCDGENNPPEVIDAGQLVADIGVAPVKPAEFIVFQISQSTAGAESVG